MTREITLPGGETYDLDELTIGVRDNLILSLVLLQGVPLGDAAKLFQLKKQQVEVAVGRARAAMTELGIDPKTAAIMRCTLALQQLGEPTSLNATARVALEKLLASLSGYDNQATERMVTVYVGADGIDDPNIMQAAKEYHLPGGKVMKFPKLEEVHLQPGGDEEDA